MKRSLSLFRLLPRQLLLVTLLLCCCSAVGGDWLVTHVPLPVSMELHCLHFDGQGLLWLGTSEGVKYYDGYVVRSPFESVVSRFPQLGSDVRSLATDHGGTLWAGTNDGLVRINPLTNAARLYRFPKQSQQIIYRLFVSSAGRLYVGTDDGFSVYDAAKDRFAHFNRDRSRAVYPDGHMGRYEGWGVKDFAETPDGDILIGTWKQGLWRYSPRTGRIRAYAPLNRANSAYCLLLTAHQPSPILWIGTQGCGVQRLGDIGDYCLHSLQAIPEHSPSVVYALAQTRDGQLQVCTGDTIQVLTGPDGALWLATRTGGILRKQRREHLFGHFGAGPVCSIFTADGTSFYIGQGWQGLAWLNRRTGETRHGSRVPGFSAVGDGLTTRVTSIVRRWNGELWMAAGDNGVFVSHPDGSNEVLYANSRQLPCVKDNVTWLMESRRNGSLWIGQRQGVSVLTKEGKWLRVKLDGSSTGQTGYFMVNHIVEDHLGRIWVSSANSGIVRLDPPHHSQHSISNPQGFIPHRYPSPLNVTACFEDSRHRLWAIGGFGLLRYDGQADRFVSVNDQVRLSGSKVLAINEDAVGNLWLATDRALVRTDGKGTSVSFAAQDGLPDASFASNATFRRGDELFFGTTDGIVCKTSRSPSPSEERERGCERCSLLITDIRVDGTSVQDLDSAARAKVLDAGQWKEMRLSLPASAHSLAVDFSLLTYSNQDEVQYAYRLEGRDKGWQYVDGKAHRAVFDGLSPGTYRLRARAADSHGRWHELPYKVTVRVPAPWYATWWACLAYTVLLSFTVRLVWKYAAMRREVKQSRRFSAMLSLSSQGSSISSPNSTPSAGRGSEPPKSALDENGRQTAPSAQEECAHPLLVRGEGRKAEDSFLSRATTLVRDHLADADYNRDRLAADLGMSVSSLYGRLRESTGLSVQTFIQTIRLNAARDILRAHPGMRVSELAYSVGFNTPKYFSQCFRKAFGHLPSEVAK